MDLVSFEINNFRSIRHSGEVPVKKLTVLVGRNESGKSNVLYALERIKNAEGQRLSLLVRDDYPVDALRDAVDYDEDTIRLFYEISSDERNELVRIWPRAAEAEKVEVIKRYENESGRDAFLYIGFHDLIENSESSPQAAFRATLTALKAAFRQSDTRLALATHAESLLSDLNDSLAVDKWKPQALQAVAALHSFATEQGIPLTTRMSQRLDELRAIAKSAGDDAKQASAARAWVAKRIPRFVYIDEYPDIPGRQSISKYLADVEADTMDRSDEVFSDLLLVAGIDLQELQELAETDVDERADRLRTASAVLTERIQKSWHDRKIRIRLDADHDTLRVHVADETLEYGTEINLEERSKGFQWFFGFLITVVAQRLRTSDESPSILLLDEAGLHLHPGAQRYLLSFLTELPNQTIYCTHLPFMIPYDDFSCVRAVQYDTAAKTTIEASLGNDAAASILQSLLGYHMAQSFLVSDYIWLVEGVTDHWILNAFSSLLNVSVQNGLHPKITIAPCNGLTKTAGFASLFRSHKLNVVILLDSSDESREYAARELVKSKLVNAQSILFVGDYVGSPAADIEDLLDEPLYHKAVEESYGTDFPAELPLDARIPRIVKRYETAFRSIGRDFSKTRPAKYLSEMIQRNTMEVSDECKQRFLALFRDTEQAMERATGRKIFK